MRKIVTSLSLVFLLTACGGMKLSENAVASENGLCPADHSIKGNRNSEGEWIYHEPGGQYYDRTDAEECFGSPADAEEAGYRKSKR